MSSGKSMFKFVVYNTYAMFAQPGTYSLSAGVLTSDHRTRPSKLPCMYHVCKTRSPHPQRTANAVTLVLSIQEIGSSRISTHHPVVRTTVTNTVIAYHSAAERI